MRQIPRVWSNRVGQISKVPRRSASQAQDARWRRFIKRPQIRARISRRQSHGWLKFDKNSICHDVSSPLGGTSFSRCYFAFVHARGWIAPRIRPGGSTIMADKEVSFQNCQRLAALTSLLRAIAVLPFHAAEINREHFPKRSRKETRF